MDKEHYDAVAKPKENDNPTGTKRSFEEDFRQIRLKMRSLLADGLSSWCTTRRGNYRFTPWWWPRVVRT